MIATASIPAPVAQGDARFSKGILSKAARSLPEKTAERKPKFLTLERFRALYSDREDGYKYEYNNGLIEKTPSNMKIKQVHIINNIYRRFTKTGGYLNGDNLCNELEQITSPIQMRKPDICHVAAQKIENLDETVSEFVIEIISPTDRVEMVDAKLLEYFAGGVKVVWQIIPHTKSVKVFTSPNTVKICFGDEICSAAPVVPDFEMTADEVFFK